MSDGSTAPFVAPGDLLADRWEVQQVLPGAMGAVLVLLDPATGLLVAAKTPRPDLPLDPDVLRRFGIEARNWLTLGAHENVVEALFLEEIAVHGRARPFLFLEYVDGPTLREVLDIDGSLAIPAALDVATGMAWGLVHAHGEQRPGARLVHRDLKPDNVFVTRDRIVKVSDFGISRALDTTDDVAAEGAGLGTPFYAAPEQMKDARSAGPASDVYAYGALLFHLLTGRPPFPADSLAQLVIRVLREDAPAARDVNSRVPVELSELVARCLRKDPADRPPSFGRIVLDLSEIREQDELWTPSDGALSCSACGWACPDRVTTCVLCGETLDTPRRYAPVSPRANTLTPTLGRTGGEGRLRVEGLDVRPRVVREGEQLLVTVLLGNDGSEPVDDVFVPFVLPDRHAFVRPEGHRRGFRGRVPPTAADAPLRISWAVRPIRPGTFSVAGLRVRFRTADGERCVVRAPEIESFEVLARAEVPFHGRERERAALSRCLSNADRGACAVLLGRRGLGKSRLVHEVRGAALARGFTVARGRCLDRGVEVRGALKEALRHLLGVAREQHGAAALTTRVVALLGDAARSEPGLVEFLVDELLGRALSRGESAGVMWSRFAAAFGRRRPLLLVLEDVHRDPDVATIALQMAAHVAHEGATFMALLTGRPDLEDGPEGADFVARLDRLSDQIGCATRLLPGPLDAEAVARIAEDTFAPNDFAESAPWLLARLARVSGGNPLFVSELLRALRSPGAEREPLVETRDGCWTATAALSPDTLDELVPPRLEQLVVARLRTLPEETARVALACGVLGDVFELDLLRELVGSGPSLERALAWLAREGVLRQTGDSVPRIRFREPLLPEVLTRECAAAQPDEYAAWNARAGEWLLARPGDGSRYALRVARHLAAAGRPAEAFRRRIAAARRLAERQSYRRAAGVLREAEDLTRDGAFDITPAERCEMNLLRAEALRFSGDFDGAERAYRTILAVAPPHAPDTASRADAYSKLGKVLEARGRLDEALEAYAQGLAVRVAHGLDADVPMSLANLAGLHLLRGEIARAEHYVERALRRATEADAPRPLAAALVLRARLLLVRGEHVAALRTVRDGLRAARRARDRSAVADAWNVVGTVALRVGRAGRARRHFLRALHLRQEIGNPAAVAGSWNNVAAVDEVLGDLVSALRGYQRSADLQRRVGSLRGLGLALGNVGRVQLELGRLRTAAATLDEALAALAGAGDPVSWGAALVERARLNLARSERGDPAGRSAVADLERARELLEGRGDLDVEASLVLAEAQLTAARGDPDAALVELRRALDTDALGPSRRAELWVAVASLSEDPDDAQRAVEACAAQPEQRLRARALGARGRTRLAAGDTAGAAADLRVASGLLHQAEVAGPGRLRVLRDLARALATSDPAAAAAARDRAAALSAELLRRGFARRLVEAA